MRLRVLIVICFTLSSAVWSKAADWRGIVPLRSTRVEVERLLGPPAKREPLQFKYELDNALVYIQFSSGPCRNDRVGGWDVPEGVATLVSVFPNELSFSELKLDTKRYERMDVPETPGVTRYLNREDGVMYSVQRGRVEVIFYMPSSKDEQLRCTKDRA